MSDAWYYGQGGQQFGPVTFEQLKQSAAGGALSPSDYVWTEGMPNWKAASEIAGLFSGPPPLAGAGAPGGVSYSQPSSPASQFSGTKIAAGVMGILFGSLGVHKFVLGMVWPGLISLLLTLCSCGTLLPITQAIGIIEGILYLTKNDEDFYQTYIVEKRGWF